MTITERGSELEFRAVSVSGVEVERREDDGELRISGHAAVFDRETVIAGFFREVIRRGAFKRAIREKQDVALLLNHEPDTVMARTSNRTLTLREDDDGLFFEATLDPRDSDAQRTFAKIERGNITQMSFGFMAKREVWTEPDDAPELPLRELLDVDLWDVSPVTYPAYDDTDVQAREYARGRAVVPPQPDTQESGSEASDQAIRQRRRERQRDRLRLEA